MPAATCTATRTATDWIYCCPLCVISQTKKSPPIARNCCRPLPRIPAPSPATTVCMHIHTVAVYTHRATQYMRPNHIVINCNGPTQAVAWVAMMTTPPPRVPDIPAQHIKNTSPVTKDTFWQQKMTKAHGNITAPQPSVIHANHVYCIIHAPVAQTNPFHPLAWKKTVKWTKIAVWTMPAVCISAWSDTQPRYAPAHLNTMNIPANVLQDVNIVMDSIKVDMSTALSAECERLGGIWVDTQWVDEYDDPGAHDVTGDKQYKYFYDETGSNTKWGYCAEITDTSTSSP